MSNIQQGISNAQVGVALSHSRWPHLESQQPQAQGVFEHWKFLVGYWIFTHKQQSPSHPVP